jgi:hypothetical protein
VIKKKNKFFFEKNEGRGKRFSGAKTFFSEKKGMEYSQLKKGGENIFQTFFLKTGSWYSLGKLRVPRTMLSPAFAVTFMAHLLDI